MTLKYRRLLYSTFILAFVVITPLVILYTAGYRYNFKKNKIEKTGILYLESSPKDAKIFINGKFKDETPTRFSKMLPDTYQIEVIKDGYHPWEKNVEIRSNLTTFNRDIVLFKQNLPINIIEGEVNILSAPFNQKNIIYSIIKDNFEELKLRNLKNDSDFLIEKFNTQSYNELVFVQWSPSQTKALIKQVIGDFNKFLIVDIETLKIKELFDITRLNFDQLIWDDLSDNNLYGLRKAVLYQIDLVNHLTQSLLAANISDFQVRGNQIYFITQIVTESFLNKTILIGREIDEIEKIKLPSPSDFSLQPSTRDLLILMDKKNNDLFVIKIQSFADQDVTSNIVLQDKAKNIIWSKNLKKLLYYTDFEIWTFDFESQQKNLITRYGEIIKQALWYPKDKYIVFQVTNAIHAIEVNGQEMKNDTKLAELSDINQIVIDNSGQTLYFKGQAGSQQGIYKLELQ